jgi:tetratricopeptide (TPR) repeat protein
LLLALERAREAKIHLRKALFLEEDHASAALGLHRCATKLQDDEEASRYLRIAIRAARNLPSEAPAGTGSDLTAAEFLFVLGTQAIE